MQHIPKKENVNLNNAFEILNRFVLLTNNFTKSEELWTRNKIKNRLLEVP